MVIIIIWQVSSKMLKMLNRRTCMTGDLGLSVFLRLLFNNAVSIKTKRCQMISECGAAGD
jgi:hypothetical protein